MMKKEKLFHACEMIEDRKFSLAFCGLTQDSPESGNVDFKIRDAQNLRNEGFTVNVEMNIWVKNCLRETGKSLFIITRKPW